MQLLRENSLRLLLHLGLLTGLLVLAVVVSKSEGPTEGGSQISRASAFEVPIPKELPPLDQEDVRRKVDAVFAGDDAVLR